MLVEAIEILTFFSEILSHPPKKNKNRVVRLGFSEPRYRPHKDRGGKTLRSE